MLFRSKFQVEGDANSPSDVVKIYNNYSGFVDVSGISVTSKAQPGYGIGVASAGGYRGGYLWGDGGAYSGYVYGVYGIATGSAGTRIGVYGSASGGATNWAGYFDGNTYITQLMVNTVTPATGFAVSVNGKVICTEMKVQIKANWPDFVFADDYKLLPLEELEQSIKQYKHLPDMPSANQVDANDGKIGRAHV